MSGSQLRVETERSKREMRLRYATEMCNRDEMLRGAHDPENAIERCCNRCPSDVQVRGVIRDANDRRNRNDVRCKDKLHVRGEIERCR